MPEASDGAPLGDHRLEARSEPLSRRSLTSRCGQVSSLPTPYRTPERGYYGRLLQSPDHLNPSLPLYQRTSYTFATLLESFDTASHLDITAATYKHHDR